MRPPDWKSHWQALPHNGRSPLKFLEACWAGLAVTEETDRTLGIARREYLDSLQYGAIVAYRMLDPDPLEPLIAAEMAAADRWFRPLPGQWWTDPDRVRKGRRGRCVVAALKFVQRGGRPVEAAKGAKRMARELPPHDQDEAEMRVFHLCRVAGLPVV